MTQRIEAVVLPYRGKISRIYFRADAGFANSRYVYDPSPGQQRRERVGYCLKRPVGRPSNEVRRSHANLTYHSPRRVYLAKGRHRRQRQPHRGLHLANLDQNWSES